MIKVGVIGASGFTGEKLVEILLTHPKVKISYLSALVDKKMRFSELFSKFKQKLDLECKNLDLEEAAKSSQVLFLALPHTVSFKVAPFLLKKKKMVVDLSADYRLKNLAVYKQFYGASHKDAANLKKAVYGLPEFYRNEIKKAQLLANPGCYPTVSILSLAPLLKAGLLHPKIIIDAKSGVTGAGRKASLNFHYAHLQGNLFAYKLFAHQHTPEITQVLDEISGRRTQVIFAPHLIPAERGILITVYAHLRRKIKRQELFSVYNKHYGREPFIRIFKDKLPQLKDVIDTNFCDIGFQLHNDALIVVSAIDNLIKGASGQAIQNMNIMLGFKEELGLK